MINLGLFLFDLDLIACRMEATKTNVYLEGVATRLWWEYKYEITSHAISKCRVLLFLLTECKLVTRDQRALVLLRPERAMYVLLE